MRNTERVANQLRSTADRLDARQSECHGPSWGRAKGLAITMRQRAATVATAEAELEAANALLATLDGGVADV